MTCSACSSLAVGTSSVIPQAGRVRMALLSPGTSITLQRLRLAVSKPLLNPQRQESTWRKQVGAQSMPKDARGCIRTSASLWKKSICLKGRERPDS